MTEGKVLSDCY